MHNMVTWWFYFFIHGKCTSLKLNMIMKFTKIDKYSYLDIVLEVYVRGIDIHVKYHLR